jgi:hypothetical protein
MQCDGCKEEIPLGRKVMKVAVTAMLGDVAVIGAREDVRYACCASCLGKLFLAHCVAARRHAGNAGSIPAGAGNSAVV